MNRRLAVVLPAFNEALGIETLLWRLSRALEGHDFEILVVDDGSSDGTAEIAEALADRIPIHVVRHGTNRGYGGALHTGLLAARSRADVVITMDADDSHDPALIPLMMHGIACGSDLVVASRFVPGGREVGVPLHRMLLSRAAGLVFGRLLDIDNVHDYTSGYRAYSSNLLDQLVVLLGEAGLVREAGFTAGVELLLKADRAGGNLAEVPLVLRYDRKRSDSKLDIQQTMRDYARLISRVRHEENLDDDATAAAGPTGWRRLDLGDGMWATAGVDAATILLSFAVSWLTYVGLVDSGLLDRGHPELSRYAILACLYAATTLFAFWRFGLYVSRSTILHLRHLQRVGEALTVSIALFFAVLFFSSGNHPSRLIVFLAMAVSFPLMFLSRRLMSGWLRRRRLAQRRVSRALIYGAGWTGRLLMKKILDAPRLGTEVVGFLDDSLPVGTRVGHRLSQMETRESTAEILGRGSDLAKIATETGATELFLAVQDLTESRVTAIRAETEALGLDFGIVPGMGAVRPDQLQVDDVGAIPVLRLHERTEHPFYEFGKRALDLFLVVLLFPLVLPLGLITAVAIWLEGRPVLFRQIRIGRHGRPFTVFKFRTMHPDVDPYSSAPLTNDDPRITRVGRVIRLAGLDELPQFINVMRGEMSLVGPRPEMPHIVADYTELERERLAVRPGISGLWQLSPDRSQAIHDNLEYDLYYLRQNSLVFDLLILGETFLFVCRALSRSVAGLPFGVPFWQSAAETGVDGVGRRAGLRRRQRREREADSGFVLVALDQRCRPDEPSSWKRYLPGVDSLTEVSRVKLLVADRNSERLRELSGTEAGRPPRVEYVSYGDSDSLRFLTERAGIVVTDIPHVKDIAAASRRSVVMIRGNRIDMATRPDRALRAERVKSILASMASLGEASRGFGLDAG